MNHIGKIIKEFRRITDISRKDLARDICSEKYIYLIEKGERTLSVEMVRLIGDRVGEDLFDYYPYLDCSDPIAVREILKKFEICQRTSDYARMEEIVAEAGNRPDFQAKPWVYELQANRLLCLAFLQNEYDEVIKCINQILPDIEPRYINSIHVVNLYLLLATCYQITGDLASSKRVLELVQAIVCPKYKIEKYDHIIVTARLSLLTLHYYMKEFAQAIREGEALLQYQYDHNSYARIDYVYAFLAFSYYRTKAYDKAFAYLNQAVNMLMTHKRTLDFQHITTQDVFRAMTEDERINRELIHKLKEAYSGR